MKSFRSLGIVAALVAGAVSVSAAPLKPGPNSQEEIQEALILAGKGEVVQLGEGTFEFTGSLSLDVDGVTIAGAGIDKTILSFKNQTAGSEGLIVTSDAVTLKDFAVEDSKGDAIKAKGCNGINFLNVRAEWTGGPKETNGAYGFYPVDSVNVLIDGCVAIGASDAGIYVGQSKNIIVRHSTAKYNVAGIEIENCYNADVFQNTATHNTGGILVFDLPGLPQQGGHNVRVFDNQVVDNDTLNFAPEGNIVGNVPTGTGIMIMANYNVEVFNNTIGGNGTANVMIIAYSGGKDETKDPKYYPYPEGIHIHNNTIGTGGDKPEGVYGTLMAQVAGATLPDIVWDGRINLEKAPNGMLPEGRGIYIHDNGDADFANLDLDNFTKDPKSAKVRRDLKAHDGKMPAIKPVQIPGKDT